MFGIWIGRCIAFGRMGMGIGWDGMGWDEQELIMGMLKVIKSWKFPC